MGVLYDIVSGTFVFSSRYNSASDEDATLNNQEEETEPKEPESIP